MAVTPAAHAAPAPTQVAISAPMSLRPAAGPAPVAAPLAATTIASVSVPLPTPSPLRRKAASVD